MDNYNLQTALSAQIQMSIVLIGTVRNLPVEPIVLAKRWGTTHEKARRLCKRQHRKGSGLCSTLHCQDDSKQMIEIIATIMWNILYFETWCFPVQCPEWATDVHKYMPQILDELEFFQWHPETLSLMFSRDDVLPACICYSSKEMIQGMFYQKLKDAACHLKQLKPYTPWSNAAEK